jgi:hypothetical protein
MTSKAFIPSGGALALEPMHFRRSRMLGTRFCAV